MTLNTVKASTSRPAMGVVCGEAAGEAADVIRAVGVVLLVEAPGALGALGALGVFGALGAGVVWCAPCAAVVPPCCCAAVVVEGGAFVGSTQSSLRLTVRFSYGGVHSHVQVESR